MTYYVYILESLTSGIFYKGYTTDYIKRLEQHNKGESRYTSLHRPWKLVYVEICINKTSALKREKQLKRAKK
jgi:putative endonuclease